VRGRQLVEQRAQLGCGKVRAGQIEFVVELIEGAVADQHQDDGIVSFSFFGDLVQVGFDVGSRGIGAVEGLDFRVGLDFMEELVEILGPTAEALFVLGLAPLAGDGEVKGFCAEGRHQENGQDEKKTKTAPAINRAATCGSGQPMQLPHMTPHLRRSSHSPERSIRRSRKIMGMSHRSLVSRTVIPASE